MSVGAESDTMAATNTGSAESMSSSSTGSASGSSGQPFVQLLGEALSEGTW